MHHDIFSFNSKLVRLKVYRVRQGGQGIRQFQFQTGSIKSPDTAQHIIQRIGFNSKLVRLKEDEHFIIAVLISVSIPNWFD